jgi:trehalose 6-phosphate synthase/phosphatase
VHYLHQSYDREELAALYLASDVLLVTALRDGMNLVAKEYVATRHDERGALVLSEFAGAAIELPQAFLVNPHDIDGVKAAIVRAVQISPREAQRRMRAMRRRVFDHDVARWASTFLKVTGSASIPMPEAVPVAELAATGASRAGRRDRGSGFATATAGGSGGTSEELVKLDSTGDLYRVKENDVQDLDEPARHPGDRSSPLPLGLVTALEGFAMRPSLLIALDFDGVLAPIVAVPEEARALPQSREHLASLVGLPGVRLALVSGRTLADLRRVASPPPGTLLVGSHGAEISDPALGSQSQTPLDDEASALLERIVVELERISSVHEGSNVEVKPTGAVLHTRRAERDVAAKATQEALDGPASWPGVTLTHGKEVVELSVVSTTKGTALRQLRELTGADAVLYAGDDVTDERAFAVLDGDAGDVSVRVGTGETVADHRLGSPDEVSAMLGLLVDLCRE